MIRKWRRILTAACGLLWLGTAALVGAQAEALGEPPTSGVGWTYHDGTLTVAENGGAADYVQAAQSREPLKKLIISADVTEIGATGGWIFANQVTVERKNSVYRVCNGMLLQRLESGVRCVLAQWPLKTAVVPYGVTEIGDDAFSCQTELRSFILPESVVQIGFSAFENCSALSELTLPASIREVNGSAFGNCDALRRADLSQTSIRRMIDTFGFCKSLYEVRLPNTLEELCDGTFHQCGSLKILTLPSSLKKIQSGALLGCMDLRVLHIPSGAQIVLPSENEPFDAFPTLFGNTGVRTVVFEGEAAPVPAGAFDAYVLGEKRMDAKIERLIFTGEPPRGDWRDAISGLPRPPELYYSDAYAPQWEASKFAMRSGMRATALPEAVLRRMLAEESAESFLPNSE